MAFSGHKLKYDFSDRSIEVKKYINTVYLNSFEYYKKNIYRDNMSKSIMDRDLECIFVDGLSCLEDYLFYFYKFYPNRFDEIFNNLKSKLEVVTVLPKDRRGIYGQFIEDEKLIYINPELRNSSTLTGTERTKLYMCHEFGHIINSDWMSSSISYINSTRKSYDEQQLMYDGLSLIDEVTTQNRAEDITYYFAGKIRPPKGRYRFIREINGNIYQIFDGEIYQTNFDYYGELEDPAVSFGKTLPGISSLDSSSDVLRKLSSKALDKKFVDNLFDEYDRNGRLGDLCKLLGYMGKIKNASYALFGMAPKEYLSMSKDAKDELSKLSASLSGTKSSYHN